jgi:hypothetical protein
MIFDSLNERHSHLPAESSFSLSSKLSKIMSYVEWHSGLPERVVTDID